MSIFLCQEMLAIMKSIYDMMGRYTHPILREDAPIEHVEKFFQVTQLTVTWEQELGNLLTNKGSRNS